MVRCPTDPRTASSRAGAQGRYAYTLLATSKTSTMQKELTDIGQRGFSFVGLTVGETALGGEELVVITRRPTER